MMHALFGDTPIKSISIEAHQCALAAMSGNRTGVLIFASLVCDCMRSSPCTVQLASAWTACNWNSMITCTPLNETETNAYIIFCQSIFFSFMCCSFTLLARCFCDIVWLYRVPRRSWMLSNSIRHSALAIFFVVAHISLAAVCVHKGNTINTKWNEMQRFSLGAEYAVVFIPKWILFNSDQLCMKCNKQY